MDKALKISPENLIGDWGYVEDWTAGDAVAPTGWTMAGTAGSVAKEATTYKFGVYAMKIISGAANSYKSSISHDDYDDYQGRTIKFGMWVYCGTASKARIYLYDGSTTTNSSYHTGGGAWEFLTVSAQIGSSATELTFGCEVQSATITAYFDGGIAIEGETVFTALEDYIEDWSPTIKYNVPKFIIARRQGVHIPSTKYGERIIGISANIAGTTFTAARTTFDSVIESLNDGKKDLLLYDDRLIQAFLTSYSHKYIAALRMIQLKLRFTAPEPFYRYIARLRDRTAISSSPTSFNFAYNGTVESFPKITFTQSGNAMTSCVIENETTGQSMSFTGTVADGKKLIIDCDKATVENDGTDSIDDFTGDFLKLVPGTNYLKFTGSNTTIDVDYFKKWL